MRPHLRRTMKPSRRPSAAWSAFWTVLLAAALHARPSAGAQLQATAQMQAGSHQNPIRKVVRMLQLMSKKVVDQSQRQEKLFDKYMCYCDETGAELKKQIMKAKEQIPQLESSLKQTTAMHQQLTEDVKGHKYDRQDSQEALDTAIALREKEDEANTKDTDEMKMNVKALTQAVEVVGKGIGNLLQTDTANALKKLSVSMDMETVDRRLFAAFLEQGTNSTSDDEDIAGYTPQSGEILGILKQLQKNLEDELESQRQANDQSKSTFEQISLSKRKEIKALTKSIEDKMGRIGDLAVEKTSLANDLEDNQEGLEEDTKVRADLQQACANQQGNWAVTQKMLGEEKIALAETIKLLNDDEALELFKKTLPSPASSFAAVSFVQVSQRSTSKALALLRRGRQGDRRVALLVMALRGKQQGMDEVTKMIGSLVDVLREEQDADDSKKDHCKSEKERLEDQVAEFKRAIKNTDTAAEEAKDSLAETIAQIEAMTKGIEELDRQVKVAAENREKEHAEALEVLAENNAAKSLLDLAKNRLNKFYNPKLAKVERRPKQMSQGDTIAENFGVDPGEGPALAQAPVEAGPDLSYKKSHEAAGGATGMIDLLRADLAKENTEIETTDKLEQEDHDKFLKNAADKRALDSKTVEDLDGARADYEVAIHDHKMKKKGLEEDNMSTEKEVFLLNKDCDWLLKNHAVRKTARADEIDSLQKAKAVLAGANYS